MRDSSDSIHSSISAFSLPFPVLILNHDFEFQESNANVTDELLVALSLHENVLRDLSITRWLKSLDVSSSGQHVFKRGSFSCLLHAQRALQHYTVVVLSWQSDEGKVHHMASDGFSEFKSSVTDSNFFEFILNNLPADLAVFDRFHRYLFINPKGVSDPEIREFLIGRDDFDYCRRRNISLDIAKVRRARFEECVDFKKSVFWEDSVKGRSDETRYVLRAFSPVLGAHGEVLNVIGYGVDVTDQKEAEIMALEANKRLDLLRRFMQHTSDAMIVSEISGDIVYYNKAAAMMYGLNATFTPCHVADLDSRFRNKEIWLRFVDRLRHNGEMRLELNAFHTKKDSNIKIEQVSRIEKIVNKEYLISVSRDISKRKVAEEALLRKNQLQAIMMEIASAFINVEEEHVYATVNEALGEITYFLRAERGSIYLIDDSQTECSVRYEYCSAGILPRMDQMWKFPLIHFHSYLDKLLSGQQFVLTERDFSPFPIVHQALLASGVRGLYVVPLMAQNSCKGFICFETSRNVQLVGFDDFDLFNILGVMTMSLLNRIDFIRQIEDSKTAIIALNEDLERQVEQKTIANLELSKTLVSQEKFALLGEIVSGIAHDLNTPLSAIKVGTENVRYVLERLFKEVILKCKPEQIAFACERAMDGHNVKLQTSSQQRSEIARIKEFLVSDFQYSPEDSTRLAPLIWKAALDIDDPKSLKHVLSADNRELYLEMISLLQSLRLFTSTILSSSERAAMVVLNLRHFIRGNAGSAMQKVSLKENIETVLNVFQHALKYKVQLMVELPENLFINGHENRLFQLWSNLIKNALEALDSVSLPEKLIWVRAENKEEGIAVIIGNNGPQIPASIAKQIFEKFFTTKHDQGGTGLGLSIVRSIIDDHDAEITLRSSEMSTEFEVLFKK